MATFTTGMALLVALLIDWRWGEPPARCHPVVGMGWLLGWAGRLVAPQAPAGTATPQGTRDFKAFGLGAFAWCCLAAIVSIAFGALQHVLDTLPLALGQVSGAVSTDGVAVLLVAVLTGVALKPLLAWSMLYHEVAAVEAALGQSLAAGRQRLSWLVSRDVAGLSAAQVRESAIESLAENLNDSVVAPVFWFLLLGLPGAALYRFANTADAMWGYRGVRNGQVWEWAGKWAARADDLLSWLPARLTSVLLMAVAPGHAWRALPREARLTPSPNSGWPMAAMALALGVRLGKPGVYTLNAAGRPPQAADTTRALALARKAILALVCSALSALVLIACFR